MTTRVPVKPALLRWACERAGHDLDTYTDRFPHLPAWARGETHPTLKQLEAFASATRVPIGYLFLPEPPEERMPLPDFRTVSGRHAARPSPDLLDTIYLCQQRQEWYRDYARATGAHHLAIVGSARIADDVVTTAQRIRDALGFDLEAQRRMPSGSDALRGFIERADEAGILVMCSGVVANDNTRDLDPEEFRGFAMADDLAPVVFVNGAATKAAQMFTLAHELAHVWLGESAVSNAEAAQTPQHPIEQWCSQVAAELLAPIPRDGGGDVHLSRTPHMSKRFARALVVSTLEGQTLYRDALRMLGVSGHASFRALAVGDGGRYDSLLDQNGPAVAGSVEDTR